MGQYYIACNLQDKQMLKPHDMSDGAKLMEFGNSSNGTMTALATLLVMTAQHRAPWAGKRVVVTGDYADEGRFVPKELAAHNLYTWASGYAPVPALAGAAVTQAGTVDADGEDGPKLPGFDSAVPLAQESLEALGLPSLLKLRGSAMDGLRQALNNPKRVFEQPEDLIEATQYLTVSQDSLRCLQDLMTDCRCSGLESALAWQTVSHSEWELSRNGERIKAWHAAFSPRQRHEPPSGRKTLTFPATAEQVRKWLGIKPASLKAKAVSE